MQQLQTIIEQAWDERAAISPAARPTRKSGSAVDETIDLLDRGKLRVAEKINGEWVTHQWVEEGRAAVVPAAGQCRDRGRLHPAISTKCRPNSPDYYAEDFSEGGFRVVPPAAARKGAFIAQERDSDALLRQYRRLRR